MEIAKIKKLVKKECEELGFCPSWFYSAHLLAVEKNANLLLKKLPKANKEVVLLGVWLHDMQRIRGVKGDHQKEGAREAEKVLRKFGCDNKIINEVKNIILSHSRDDKKPETLEARILASADAMAHYTNDFYLQIATTGQRSLKDFKLWALEKLNRDYNKKISFDFAKKEIEERHRILKKVFTMK